MLNFSVEVIMKTIILVEYFLNGFLIFTLIIVSNGCVNSQVFITNHLKKITYYFIESQLIGPQYAKSPSPLVVFVREI